jgi:hypothetical protein
MLTAESNLRLFTRVRISGPPGVCVGRIEDIRSIDEMPDLLEFDDVQDLRDMGVTRVALVSYRPTDHDELTFFALEIGGDWFDRSRQALTFEVVGQAVMQ